MNWLDEMTRRFLAAYREGLQMSCTVHREHHEKFVEKARQRREKIRSAIAAHSRRTH